MFENMNEQQFALKAKAFKEKALSEGVPEAAVDRFIAARAKEQYQVSTNTQVVEVEGRQKLINLVTGEIIKDLGPTESQALNDIGNAENNFNSSGSSGISYDEVGNMQLSNSSDPNQQAVEQVKNIDRSKFQTKEIGKNGQIAGENTMVNNIAPSELSPKVANENMAALEKRLIPQPVQPNQIVNAKDYYKSKLNPNFGGKGL